MSGILLVDDEKNVLTTLGIGIRRAGYSVFEAGSGSRALELLKHETIDLVISDIRMKKMDGYELAAEISKQSPNTKIILMSAYDADEDKEKSVKKLICCRLVKPFPVEKLLNMIDRALGCSCNVLFVSNDASSEDLSRSLESDGIHCATCADYRRLSAMLASEPCDILLIDGDFLNGDGWKVLNDIDQIVPGKPVVILNGSKGENTVHTGENLAYTLLDRVAFFQDAAWGGKMLKSILGNA